MNWTTYNSAGAALSQSLTDMPVGTITGYAGAAAPSGWLLCDGAAVSRSDYAELFGVVSTTYGSGNGSTTFNVPDSSGFIILATSQAARLAAAALPQYVTSLPSNPVDGQTVVYAADATNGVMWTLRYRAAATGSYKWEFVGGSSLSATGSGGTTSSGTYQTSNTPSITLPALAGDYEFAFGGAVIDNQAGYAIAKIGLHDDGSLITGEVYCGSTDPGYKSVGRVMRATAVSSGSVINVRYKSDGSLSRVFGDLYLTARPVRVG